MDIEFYGWIILILIIGSVLGNALVLIVTWRERILHEPNKYFIALLAVADLMVSLSPEPFNAYIVNHKSHVKIVRVYIDIPLLSADRYLKIYSTIKKNNFHIIESYSSCCLRTRHASCNFTADR